MSNPNAWEFRVNGIRSNGDTFSNFHDATERLFRALNSLHFKTEGAEREHNGRAESQFIAERARMLRERPFCDVTVKGLRNGKPWVLQVNRLPWGSSPSGDTGVNWFPKKGA